MILSNSERELDAADVCIVGAGPVGLATAFKLQELGLTVTLVEMGGTDQQVLARSPIVFTNSHHALARATSRPGVGGTSALWGGRCVAFDDLDFQARAHVRHSGWPIRHEELSRHYSGALDFLRCGTSAIAAEELAPHDPAVSTAAIERWSERPDLGPVYSEMLQASDKILLVTGAVVTALRVDRQGGRIDSLQVKMAGEERTVRAKTFVLAGGGLENARLLLGLEQAATGKASLSGATGKFYQGHLTGYIAILQFNDPLLAERFFFKRDGEGRTYRQRFQISPAIQIREKLLNTVFWIDALSIADPAHGSGALSFYYLLLLATGLYRKLSEGLAPTARGAAHILLRRHFRNLTENWAWPRDLLAVLARLRRGRRTRRTLFNPQGRYLLRYHAEQVPDPASQVTLSPSLGGAEEALSVDYRIVDQDVDSVLRSHQILDEWLRRNGIGRLEYIHDPAMRSQAVSDQAFDGFHQIGLTRMAAHPSEGAADSDCRVFGLDNLYLAGSCLFPTGGHANPTLPAVALALRLAEHLHHVLIKASR